MRCKNVFSLSLCAIAMWYAFSPAWNGKSTEAHKCAHTGITFAPLFVDCSMFNVQCSHAFEISIPRKEKRKRRAHTHTNTQKWQMLISSIFHTLMIHLIGRGNVRMCAACGWRTNLSLRCWWAALMASPTSPHWLRWRDMHQKCALPRHPLNISLSTRYTAAMALPCVIHKSFYCHIRCASIKFVFVILLITTT